MFRGLDVLPDFRKLVLPFVKKLVNFTLKTAKPNIDKAVGFYASYC
jgi:hypothetical protein